MKSADRRPIRAILVLLTCLAYTPVHALNLKSKSSVPNAWALGLDGSYKAIQPVTTQTQTSTPFPCLSCDCSFMDRNGVATHCDMEINSRMMVARWLPETSTTLEVGARYGSNSCAMAAKQKQSGKLVCVDADRRVWDSLEKNRMSHTCNFHTVHGVIGKKDVSIMENGYGTLAAPASGLPTSPAASVVVPHFTLEGVEQQYNLKFDAANFDCEGCLPYVLQDFPTFPAQLKLLMIEAHDPKEEAAVSQFLTEGWELVDLMGRQRVLVNQSQTRRAEVSAATQAHTTYLADTDATCFTPAAPGSFRGNIGLSCEQVCATKNLRCDQAGMKKLSTEALVGQAFAAAGQPCTSFVDHKISSYWAGPWNAGGTCGYSSHVDWQPNCRGKAACGFRLACSCN